MLATLGLDRDQRMLVRDLKSIPTCDGGFGYGGVLEWRQALTERQTEKKSSKAELRMYGEICRAGVGGISKARSAYVLERFPTAPRVHEVAKQVERTEIRAIVH
eukprot:2182327-Amphidinium_carterae.1